MTGAPSTPSPSRRRLLQGGLSAAPVLMTLVSRPVLAQAQCQAPSGFASGNVSAPGGAICTGRVPGFWNQQQNFGMWPSPYFPTTTAQHNATLFASVFTDPHSQFTNKSLLDVLNDSGGPPSDVARYVVAALLNVAAGLTPVLTIPVVVSIWNEFISTGFYRPTAGTMWDHGQIVDYLISTMPV